MNWHVEENLMMNGKDSVYVSGLIVASSKFDLFRTTIAYLPLNLCCGATIRKYTLLFK